MSHILDRPIWHALADRQAAFGTAGERARRFDPAFAFFGAARDDAPDSLAELGALVPAGGQLCTVQVGAPPVPGTRVVEQAACVQMVWSGEVPSVDPSLERLTEADASAMQALAALTRPGPFFERTHRLGDFHGVREGGRLVAMAGERLRPSGYTEVSGVCTHPDHQGRGHARRLTARVILGIVTRGEVPFLTAYSHRTEAIGLYERLGFRWRAEVTMTVLARDI